MDKKKESKDFNFRFALNTEGADALKNLMLVCTHIWITRSSSLIIALEHRVRLLLAGTDVAAVVDFDHTLGLELRDDELCLLILLNHLVKLVQLLLDNCQLCQLRQDVSLTICLGLLSFSDLSLRSASLAGHFEHVCRHALLHC